MVNVNCEHAHNSSSKWARPGDRLHCTFQVPSLPLPTGLGPPESSTGPSPLDTFTLPPFLPSRARPGSSPLDLWQCKRGYCLQTNNVSMAAEYVCCSLTSPFFLFLRQPIKKDGLLRQPIACYEIAKWTYDFVMTYVGNRAINMTLVMLFLVGNTNFYDTLRTFQLRAKNIPIRPTARKEPAIVRFCKCSLK